MSLAIQPSMHPDYDALINPGDEKPSVSELGGYVGNEKAQQNLDLAKSTLTFLLNQGIAFDNPQVQKLFYEIEYWTDMISAAEKYGESELMKNPSAAKEQHLSAHNNAIASLHKLDSLNTLPESKTGTDASSAIEQALRDLDGKGLSQHKMPYLLILKNKGEKRKKELEAKVSNNKATSEEKEELKNLKGFLAVLEKYIEGNGATTLDGQALNNVFSTAANGTDTISEYVDALSGEGDRTGGYVGNAVANEYVTEAKNEIKNLEAQGKTSSDPELQYAKFKLAYWEKMIEYAGIHGEEKLKNDPELAKTCHDAALAHARSMRGAEIPEDPSTAFGDVPPLTISEYVDALSGEGINTGGYVGNTIANQYVSEAENGIQNLKGQGKTIKDPEMQQAEFKLAYWEKMIEYACIFGEEELKNDPELAKICHDAALAHAKGTVIAAGCGYPAPPANGRSITDEWGIGDGDLGARAACDALRNKPVMISGIDMYEAIIRGTKDFDNSAFSGEFQEFLSFARENWERMTPEAKRVFLTYQNAAMDAQAQGKTGANELEYAMLKYQLMSAVQRDVSASSSGIDDSTAPGDRRSSGPNQINEINDLYPDMLSNNEKDESDDLSGMGGTESAGAENAQRGSRRAGRGIFGKDRTEIEDDTYEVSRGGIKFEDRTYANAFEYAEAVFADLAYLMQDLLKTKVDELKKMKDEVAKANEALALLNGAKKKGSDAKCIVDLEKPNSKEELEQARKEGRIAEHRGENGEPLIAPRKNVEFVKFCKEELDMDIMASYISNEDYEKLKTKLESYISSRQTDMQKLSTDIQRIKDKFDQMWRLVGGLISMEGDLNKALVQNIR